jgi:putative ABC transport system permease protein
LLPTLETFWLPDFRHDTRRLGVPGKETRMSLVTRTLRSLRRDAVLTCAAVGSLALGLAATTAMFSVLNALLLTPPPYRDGAGLVVFHEVIDELRHQYPSVPASAPHFMAWKERCRSCGELAALAPMTVTLSGAGEPARVAGARVSANLFRLLGIQPHRGRDFRDEEDVPGRERVVLLSHGLWRDRFGSAGGVVGQSIRLDGVPHEVVGVLPPGFRLPPGNQLAPLVRFPDRVDVFRPIAFSAGEQATAFNYPVIGRLAPGATIAQATAELEALQAELGRESPIPMTLGIALRPLHDQMVGDVRHALLLLMAASTLVLLIVCLNIANLLLARATARRGDAAVRLAMGAGKWQVVREAMIESGAIAAAGCGLGLLLAWWGVDALVTLGPPGLPRLEEVGRGGRVLAFGGSPAAPAALLFGLLPALRLASANAADLLRAAHPGADGRPGAARLRQALLAVQIGACVLLLSTGGLLVRSYGRLAVVDPGFRPEGILTFEVSLPRGTHGGHDGRTGAMTRMLEQLRGVPAVQSAGLADTLPLSGQPNVNIVSLEHDTRPAIERPAAHRRYVSGGYFATLGLPVLAGRTFDDRDRDQPVAIVSAQTAETLWPGEDPLGRRLHTGDTDAPLARVIGIAADARTVDLREVDALMVYEPYWVDGDPDDDVAVVLRVEGDPLAAAAAARERIRAAIPGAPVSPMRPMSARVQEALSGPRAQVMLMALFAVVALVIANLGVYGVTAYVVARRVRELGIRTALGARPRDMYRLVLDGTLPPVALGLAAGLAGAFGLRQLTAGVLFDLPEWELLTLASIAAIVLGTALLACVIPARRAARVDPIRALRHT